MTKSKFNHHFSSPEILAFLSQGQVEGVEPVHPQKEETERGPHQFIRV